MCHIFYDTEHSNCTFTVEKKQFFLEMDGDKRKILICFTISPFYVNTLSMGMKSVIRLDNVSSMVMMKLNEINQSHQH